MESLETEAEREVIKCVVVGDTGVGKTRLICARATEQRLSLEQLLAVHTPTVWAIDRYRMCPGILERSLDCVDGVDVSLRLWDTFGEHANDRRFAYGRSDVVVLCFAVHSARSFRHARSVWLPEIRRHCPHTPLLLVACQNDLRHLAGQEDFAELCRQRRPFAPPVQPHLIVPPERGRELAREVGALAYYETSVLTDFGVRDVFRNACRAALRRRRQQRFWIQSLDRVRPLDLQRPFLPPRPASPTLRPVESSYDEDMGSLTACWSPPGDSLLPPTNSPDVLLAISHGPHQPKLRFDRGLRLWCHRLMLAASSAVFCDLFASVTSLELEIPAAKAPTNTLPPADTASTTMSATHSACEQAWSEVSSPTESLPPRSLSVYEERGREWLEGGATRLPEGVREVEVVGAEEAGSLGLPLPSPLPDALFVVHATAPVDTPASDTAAVLRFLYTGQVPSLKDSHPDSLRQLATWLGLPELLQLFDESPDLPAVRRGFVERRNTKLVALGLENGLFCDVEFVVEKGRRVGGHRFLLGARCEVMRAMLSPTFREGREGRAALAGVSRRSLGLVQSFLYADRLEVGWAGEDVWALVAGLELANRLCLPGLRAALETALVQHFRCAWRGREEELPGLETLLEVLPLAAVHNAAELEAWGVHAVATNYNRACAVGGRAVRGLGAGQRAAVVAQRWPPVWYLKEMDAFQRASASLPQRPPPRLRQHNGCLCFSRRHAPTPTLASR